MRDTVIDRCMKHLTHRTMPCFAPKKGSTIFGDFRGLFWWEALRSWELMVTWTPNDGNTCYLEHQYMNSQCDVLPLHVTTFTTGCTLMTQHHQQTCNWEVLAMMLLAETEVPCMDGISHVTRDNTQLQLCASTWVTRHYILHASQSLQYKSEKNYFMVHYIYKSLC